MLVFQAFLSFLTRKTGRLNNILIAYNAISLLFRRPVDNFGENQR